MTSQAVQARIARVEEQNKQTHEAILEIKQDCKDIKSDVRCLRESVWALKLKVALLAVLCGGGGAGAVQLALKFLV